MCYLALEKYQHKILKTPSIEQQHFAPRTSAIKSVVPKLAIPANKIAARKVQGAEGLAAETAATRADTKPQKCARRHRRTMRDRS